MNLLIFFDLKEFDFLSFVVLININWVVLNRFDYTQAIDNKLKLD